MALATAIVAANAAVSIMGAFATRGDGGLGASLRAVQEKLGVVVDGIGSLQRGLAELADLIRDQEEALEELPKTGFASARLWELQACAGVFEEELGRPGAPDRLSAGPVSADVRVLRDRVREARSALSFTEPGRSALGALASLTAFAMETALEILVEDGSGLGPVLDTYVAWTSAIASPGEGSAASLLHRLEGDLATRAAAMLKLAAVPEDGFAAGSGDAAGRSVHTYCHVEWRPGRDGQIHGRFPHDTDVVPYQDPPIPEEYGFASTVRYLREVSYATREGIRTWTLKGAEMGAHASVATPGWWPDALPPCEPARDMSDRDGPMSATREQADRRAADMGLPEQRRIQERVAASMVPVNLLEQRVAFLRRSIAIAETVNAEARNWRAAL